MGASGNLSLINLSEISFKEIKDTMLNALFDYNYDDEFLAVYEMKNIQEFIDYFNSKVADYCPDENGIVINGNNYTSWGDSQMPQIIDNYLVLYDTDQQMDFQNLPTEILQEYISYTVEIWT